MEDGVPRFELSTLFFSTEGNLYKLTNFPYAFLVVVGESHGGTDILILHLRTSGV